MAPYKRGKWWWTDFSVNGQRFRESLDTTDWREAQAKEKEMIAQASDGKLLVAGQGFSRLAFGEAADRYLDGRKLELSARSLKKEQQLLVKPRIHFGAMQVAKISTEGLQSFREWRSKNGVGPSYINMETSAISRILKRAKRWHLVAADLKPLKERRNPGRVLSPQERCQLLSTAASKPEWQVAHCAAVLALNTTMRGCELKSLVWRDVNLLDSTIAITRSKTEAGERIIPLNVEARTAILDLFKRAQAFSAGELDHYVFPACEHGRINPAKQQQSWRTAWRHLTRQAGLPNLRFHDLRHHAITELAESEASEQTIMSIAGHVSPRMLRHYSHIRLDAKRDALNGLAARNGRPSYVTNRVTTSVSKTEQFPEVVEKYGRPERARTVDLHRVKVAL
jgi:integrase